MFKLQKWAIRTISHEHYRSPYRPFTGPLFKKHNVLNVFDSFKLELGVFMYKHKTKLLPQTFCNYFIKHNQIHRYSTRNSEDYSIHKATKMFSDRSVRVTGPSLWNSLDIKFKHCKTTKHFRNEFKSSLITKVSFIILRHWPWWLRAWGGESSLTKMLISQSPLCVFASAFTLITLALCVKCRRTLKGTLRITLDSLW